MEPDKEMTQHVEAESEVDNLPHEANPDPWYKQPELRRLYICLGFLFLAAYYFALADGLTLVAPKLQVAGGVFCFLAGLTGWYLTFALLLQDAIVTLPLGDTSHLFTKNRRLGTRRFS